MAVEVFAGAVVAHRRSWICVPGRDLDVPQVYPGIETGREQLRYNRTRLHSGLGYRTPQEVMDEYLNGQEAA